MTNKKILITHDRNGAAALKREIRESCEACNSLLSIFHEFQSWERVTTMAAFTALVSDPGQYFDEVLLRNVKLDTGGRQANPEVLASLVGIHRAEFLNAVAGLPLTSDDCIPCQRVKVRPGKTAISKRAFESYAQYLNFKDGTFTMDQSKVDTDLDKFNTYATSPEEIARYDLYKRVASILNEWDTIHPFPAGDKLAIKKAFNLHLTRASEGAFMINDEALKNDIINLKHTNDGTN